jgi:hypothetical protein
MSDIRDPKKWKDMSLDMRLMFGYLYYTHCPHRSESPELPFAIGLLVSFNSPSAV